MPSVEVIPGELIQGAAPTEAGAVADLAAEAAEVKHVEIPELNAIAVRERNAAGASTVTLIDVEPHLLSPIRKRGHVQIHEAGSFAAYVNEQKDADSRLYASRDAGTVVAVLNDDPHGERTTEGAWRDHRATLSLKRTPEWTRWRQRDGKLGDQVEFAEHLEVCLADIVEPLAADLVEIARSFTASTSIKFRSARNLTSGETQIAYDEEIEARAGATKSIDIPREFKLLIAPYHGIAPLQITARLRYRLRDGGLAIGYVLDKPDDVELQAFSDVVALVGELTQLQPLMGVPASERA